jgi:hypothetical protein
MIELLFAAHVFGDFPLQNHWMQAKSKSSWVCTAHVAAYSTPFVALVIWADLPLWAFCAIMIQHWLQDRFALHLVWMRIYKQTMPQLWPVGPLCMDQAWHITFVTIVGLLF